MAARPDPDAFAVQDRETAEDFIRWCVRQIGFGFHPDTRFGEYVTSDGESLYSAAAADRLDSYLELTFAYCDPYETGMQEFQRLKRDCGIADMDSE